MAAPQRLSAASMARYRAVVDTATVFARRRTPPDRVGLLDRKNDDALALLDLDSGELRPSPDEACDIILVEQPRYRYLQEPDFLGLKSRLAPDGLILLRRRTRVAWLLGRLMSRRQEDAACSAFGAGHDRREAALRRASLYMTPLRVALGASKEAWLLASTTPLADHRFRDQIGRVATDYLRTLAPVTVGLGTGLPGL